MRIRRRLVEISVALGCTAIVVGCQSDQEAVGNLERAARAATVATPQAAPTDITRSSQTPVDSTTSSETARGSADSDAPRRAPATANPTPTGATPRTGAEKPKDEADSSSGESSPTSVASPSDQAQPNPNSFEFEVAPSVSLVRPAVPESADESAFRFELGSAQSPISEELRSDPIYYTSVREVDCPSSIKRDAIRCQRVTLPEDYDDPANGRSIELMVATIDNGDPLGIGPVVYLQGGPGVGVVDNATTYVGGSFDIVLVDQRGTGLSKPSLDCAEQIASYATSMSLESRSERASQLDDSAERRCLNRLIRENVDLTSFTSENNAEDIALLRRVLGYDQWNLFGSSYGTRLALTVLRDHPEGVRSVVLDAVFPPEADFFGALGSNYLRALDQLNAACKADTLCEQNYGDLRQAVDVAAALLDYEPITLQVERPVSGDKIEVVVDGPRFHSFVFDRLYSAEALSRLPRLIHGATTGDVGELTWQSVSGADPEGFDFAEAMYWSVMCSEEVPFIDPNADKELAARADDSIVFAFSTSAFKEPCSIYRIEPGPSLENEPVLTDVPILAATGSFDPVTPPEWGRALAERLDNATFVEFTNRAHGSASNCFMKLTNAFFSDPTAPVDASCADEAPITFE